MGGTCKATGEIDMATASAFKARLHHAIVTSQTVRVVVDCSELTFMDSTGFHVLVDETRYAARRHHMLVIRNMSPACARVLAVCDWDNELHIEKRQLNT